MPQRHLTWNPTLPCGDFRRGVKDRNRERRDTLADQMEQGKVEIKALGSDGLEFSSKLCLFARYVTLGKSLLLCESWCIHL